jgi:hypothetical protein
MNIFESRLLNFQQIVPKIAEEAFWILEVLFYKFCLRLLLCLTYTWYTQHLKKWNPRVLI